MADPVRSWPQKVYQTLDKGLAPPPRRVPKPMPPGPTMPPDYMGSDTCAECWEPCGAWLFPALDRWNHRRRWGHNPVVLYPQPTAAEQHQENVEAAHRYQEARRG